MNIVEKVNNTRYTLKEVLKDEWDTSTIANLSNSEVEKMYTIPSGKINSLSLFGVASGCNLTLKHKYMPSHSLHIIYYNFPEIGRLNSKVTKSACDKLSKLYEEEIIQYEDSLLIIINDTISESLETSFNLMNIKLQSGLETKGLSEEIISEMKENDYPLKNSHFRNVHLFDVNNLTNNMLNHRLVPKSTPIRKTEDINKILEQCNCSMNQLPIILKNDMISKLIRLAPGDICKIVRKSSKCGDYPFYRICK
mgnify:FL=1|tara:strand:- start:932 stop:1687 length:756 start_codon:yes stop_codon:yes gene_type:complete